MITFRGPMRNVRLASLLATSFDVLLYFVSVGLGLLIAGLAYFALRDASGPRPEDLASDPVFFSFQTLGVLGSTLLLAAARYPHFFRAIWRVDPRKTAAGAGRGAAMGLIASSAAVGLILAWAGVVRVTYGEATGAIATVWIQANVALTEEAIFRGYLWFLLENRHGQAAALGLTTLLFALAHSANPAFTLSFPPLLNLLLAGLILGNLRRRMGFAPAAGWHFGWNAGLGAFFGLPVSGITFPALLRVADTAPTFWAGGAFGPEGGLAGTVVLGASLGLLGTHRWKGLSRTILKVRGNLR